MPSKEQLAKAIECEQNAIAFYEQIKTLTDDMKHVGALNKLIMSSHQRLRDYEKQHEEKYGEVVSPSLEKLQGREFTACLRRACNAIRWS
jgi:rubrerythrin